MKRFCELLATAFVLTLTCSCTPTLVPRPQSPETGGIDPSEVLVTDPALTTGSLPNGLTYYIRENHEPQKRAELRLVVNAGSILEDDDQKGLAHFVEHMAFNGTRHFEKQELVDYLESIGMQFGPDLNAYTSFDETVYLLQIPTDSTEIVETAFQILEDWARFISFEDDEIDRERGVIIEEWRLGRGADARIRDEELPVLMKGSKYAERLPIGDPDIIKTFPHDTIRRFYRDWYRPDLMAVVAVGDFDRTWIEALIRRHFSYEPVVEHPRPRETQDIPGHRETFYAIVDDPEATGSSVGMYILHDAPPHRTVGDFREMLMGDLFNAIFSNRLDELARTADPPFLNAYSALYGFTPTTDFYLLGAEVTDNGIERGFRAILTEAERIRRHGFTQPELDRQKTEYHRMIEQVYRERDKMESGSFAGEYIDHFLMGGFIPGIEREYELYRALLPGITLGAMNAMAGRWITEGNRVVLADGPRKEGVTMPDEADLSGVLVSVARQDTEPYVDDFTERPLVPKKPKPAAITGERYIPELEVTEWTLSNGIRVVLKPTDFRNDEIRFTAFSDGGYSLVPLDDHIPAITADDVVTQCGVGDFSLLDLDKLLAGKIVSVSPYINQLQEGFSGGASPQDIKEMFQLIYLYVYSPRKDSTDFRSYENRLRGYIENRNASPEVAFSDTIAVTLADYNPWVSPWTMELLNELRLDASYAIYRDRFADTGDFTFFFVGNFTLDGIRPLVATYLGNLPSTGRKETWHDLGIEPPEGVIRKEIRRGTEQVSRVELIFTGPFEWNRQNRYTIQSMAAVLEIQLREVLREDLGGTYDVNVSAGTSHYPHEEYELSISFGCNPDRVEELIKTTFAEIRRLQTDGPLTLNLDKVKEMQRRQQEVSLRENSYWLSSLSFYYRHREDPRQILELDRYIDALSAEDVREAANRYFDFANYMTFILYPVAADP